MVQQDKTTFIVVLLSLLLGGAQLGHAQIFETVVKEHNDCHNAIHLTDTLYGPFAAPVGSGEIMDVEDEDSKNIYFFKKERNSAWYTFEATHNAELSLAIVPSRHNDDINFLLFKVDTTNFCEAIRTCIRLPVRSNMTRVNSEFNGMTGLRPEATETHLGSGRGDAFCTPVKVKRGEHYMLVLNHKSREEIGHSIYLRYNPSYRAPKNANTTAYEERIARLSRDHELKVSVKDKRTGKPLPVDIYLEKDEEGTVFREVYKDKLAYTLAAFSTYTLKIKMDNFLVYSNEIRTQNETGVIQMDLKFEPILDGTSFNLNGVRFRKNETTLLSSSTSDLDDLKSFMELNPLVEIEIVGHVNAPEMENTMKVQKMSRDRAKAIYEFLLLQGVHRKRMTYLGKGNTEMIFEDPQTSEEKEANRRVEVIIRN